MYIGRFLVVGPDRGAYRVSSRSFPDREAVKTEGTVTVRPTPAAPETDNPYVQYNAVRVTDRGVVLGNGSHVDPIAEKLGLGYPARDAVGAVLLALDFEKDDYDTPRIAGVVGTHGDPSTPGADPGATVGIVRRDAVLVEAVDEPTLVATYEKDSPEPVTVESTGSDALAREVYDLPFDHAVCVAAVTVESGHADVAVYNG